MSVEEAEDVSLGTSVLVVPVWKSSNFVVGQLLSCLNHWATNFSYIEVQYMITLICKLYLCVSKIHLTMTRATGVGIFNVPTWPFNACLDLYTCVLFAFFNLLHKTGCRLFSWGGGAWGPFFFGREGGGPWAFFYKILEATLHLTQLSLICTIAVIYFLCIQHF